MQISVSYSGQNTCNLNYTFLRSLNLFLLIPTISISDSFFVTLSISFSLDPSSLQFHLLYSKTIICYLSFGLIFKSLVTCLTISSLSVLCNVIDTNRFPLDPISLFKIKRTIADESRDYGEMPHTGLLPGLLNLLSHTAQAHLPRHGTCHSGLSPPTSIIKQEHTSQTCQRSKIMQKCSQLTYPLPTLM